MNVYRILCILTATVSILVAACPDGVDVCLELVDTAVCSDGVSTDETACIANATCGLTLSEQCVWYTKSVGYSTTAAIAGFQMAHNGSISGAGGGDSKANGFDINFSSSMILAFSFSGSSIPVGSGVLYGYEVTTDSTVTVQSFESRQFSAVDATALVTAWDGSDCMDETACNYNASADFGDNTLCVYPETNFNCNGECIATGDHLDEDGLDCAGTCGGELVSDACGNCGGDCEDNGSGVVTCGDSTNNTTLADCAGECGGESLLDNCNVCDADTANDCVQDACGEWGGSGVADACDCIDTTGLNDDGCCDAVEADCAGTCGGSAVVDCAAVCNGPGAEDTDGACCATGVFDCAGACDGTAELDACGECGGSVTDPTACTADNDDFIVHDLELSNIYPNPFNPSTTIEFSVMNAGNHKIDIYSTSGKLVEIISQGYVSPGSYQVTWDADGMPSGIYVVRMITNGKLVNSRKVMLLK